MCGRAQSTSALTQYEMRRYEAWYRYITLALLAHALLEVTRLSARQGHLQDGKGGSVQRPQRHSADRPRGAAPGTAPERAGGGSAACRAPLGPVALAAPGQRPSGACRPARGAAAPLRIRRPAAPDRAGRDRCSQRPPLAADRAALAAAETATWPACCGAPAPSRGPALDHAPRRPVARNAGNLRLLAYRLQPGSALRGGRT